MVLKRVYKVKRSLYIYRKWNFFAYLMWDYHMVQTGNIDVLGYYYAEVLELFTRN